MAEPTQFTMISLHINYTEKHLTWHLLLDLNRIHGVDSIASFFMFIQVV